MIRCCCPHVFFSFFKTLLASVRLCEEIGVYLLFSSDDQLASDFFILRHIFFSWCDAVLMGRGCSIIPAIPRCRYIEMPTRAIQYIIHNPHTRPLNSPRRRAKQTCFFASTPLVCIGVSCIFQSVIKLQSAPKLAPPPGE